MLRGSIGQDFHPHLPWKEGSPAKKAFMVAFQEGRIMPPNADCGACTNLFKEEQKEIKLFLPAVQNYLQKYFSTKVLVHRAPLLLFFSFAASLLFKIKTGFFFFPWKWQQNARLGCEQFFGTAKPLHNLSLSRIQNSSVYSWKYTPYGLQSEFWSLSGWRW